MTRSCRRSLTAADRIAHSDGVSWTFPQAVNDLHFFGLCEDETIRSGRNPSACLSIATDNGLAVCAISTCLLMARKAEHKQYAANPLTLCATPCKGETRPWQGPCTRGESACAQECGTGLVFGRLLACVLPEQVPNAGSLCIAGVDNDTVS